MTATSNQKSIDVLNHLIEINSNRYDGYEYACNHSKGSTIRFLFMQFTETSRICINELIFEVEKSGGTPKRASTKDETVLRVWMDAKIAISDNNNKALFNSCEFEEAIIVNEYETTLIKKDYQDAGQQDLIQKQFLRLKRDASKMKNLRKAFIHD